MSAAYYILLLGAIGLGRLIELRISHRRQRGLAAQGIAKVPEPHFHWMILLHAGVLLFSGVEVWLLKRQLIPALAMSMGLILLVANGLRWWVIRTMADHWNVEVMNSVSLGIVTDGPFRWIRHPNYLAVILELAAIPLLYSAWLTALAGSLANAWILSRRLAVEEAILFKDPAYRALFGPKPRFIPRLGARWRTF